MADQDGNQVSLSGFKGKKVILYFYPKDQTPGCTAEACNLRDNYKGLQRKGYEVIGISTDTEKSHQKFIEKQNLPFRLLADVDKVAHAKYGTWVEKSMFRKTAWIAMSPPARETASPCVGKVNRETGVTLVTANCLKWCVVPQMP